MIFWRKRKPEEAESVLELISQLKTYVADYVSKRVPGYLTMLDMLSMQRAGMTALDLLFHSPGKLYEILASMSSGGEATADFVLRMLFAKPIAIWLGDPSAEPLIAEAIKRGDKEALLNLVARRARRSRS